MTPRETAMAKNPRKCFVAAKLEGTAGTPEALPAAEAAILAYEPDISPDIQISERAPAGICSGTLPGQPGLYKANIRLRCELKGSGSVDALPHWAATLLIASAMKATTNASTDVTCSLVTSFSDQQTATVAVWKDGRKHVAAGCMFNAKIVGRPGDPMMIEFEGMGIHITPVDENAPTGITHESTKPLRLAGVTFTIGGTSKAKLNNFELDLGNDIQLRTDIGAASALAHAYFADRRPTLNCDPEAVSISDDDVWGDFLAGTPKAVVFSIGSVVGNRIAIAAPAFSHDNPSSEDAQGLLRDRLPGRLNTVNGADDQLTIVFT